MNQTATNEREVIAALDIGSNSFHLIVARVVDGSIQTLHKVKQRVRLAQGLSADGTLNQPAIDRAIDTLKQMAQTLQDIPPNNVRVVATYTLRKATNVQEFLNQVEAVFPYPIEIIPGKGSGQLKKRVLRFLEEKRIKQLYHRVEKDGKNFGRLFVHFKF